MHEGEIQPWSSPPPRSNVVSSEPDLAAGSIGRLRRHRCRSQDRNARRPCQGEGPAAAFNRLLNGEGGSLTLAHRWPPASNPTDNKEVFRRHAQGNDDGTASAVKCGRNRRQVFQESPSSTQELCIQLELALEPEIKGEVRNAGDRGTEARMARAEPEYPAIGQGPSMEAVLQPGNVKKALARVRCNKGAHGIGGMTVEGLSAYLQDHWPGIRSWLLDGTYTPLLVRRVEIPKASRGVRPLGVPTVLDRLIRQAVIKY